MKDYKSLKNCRDNIVSEATVGGKAALALSGGIDSAILARLVPAGTKAYTFRCVVPRVKVTDESIPAKRWAEMNNLDHEVIDIYWRNIESAADVCMRHKGTSIHSIEAQIFIAATKAKKEGKTKFILGENADIIYWGWMGC